eukprot:Rhum_TRINITY_DN10671_c0_g1::Rhum_TRINITY_DN10671_c0_g1_i1::g.39546::m.39546
MDKAAQADRATAIRDEGNTLFNDGDYAGALQAYSQGLTLEQGVCGGTIPVTDVDVLRCNAAACILKIVEGGTDRDLLLQCVALCTEVLNRNPAHTKARYRRACANQCLGYATLALTDLRILLTVQPKERQAATRLEALLAGDGGGVVGGLHRVVAEGAVLLDKQAMLTHTKLEEFFADEHGEATLLYMLSSYCVSPTLLALDILQGAAVHFWAEVVEMRAVLGLLRLALEHPTGRVVRLKAIETLTRLTKTCAQHHGGRGTAAEEAVVDLLDRHGVWPAVGGLVRRGDAAGEALRLCCVVEAACSREVASRYAHVLGVASTQLWRNPDTVRSIEDLGGSLDAASWDVLIKCLHGLTLVASMKSALIALTQVPKFADVSSDAATVVGIIDDLLHPEDHCCMEPAVPPLPEVNMCPVCTTPDPKVLCPSCRITLYCSEHCRKQDWNDTH